MTIVPVFEKAYIGEKTMLRIEVVIPNEETACSKNLLRPYEENLTIAIVQLSKNNPEIRCELSLSSWKELRSLVNMTNRQCGFYETVFSSNGTLKRYEAIKETTEAVYCAIQIKKTKKLTFEQQIAYQRLSKFDCNCLPIGIKDGLDLYTESLIKAKEMLNSHINTKISAFFAASNLQAFTLYYCPLLGQNKRTAPWEIQLSHKESVNSKPRKGLPIKLEHKHLADIIETVDWEIAKISI